MKQCSVCQEEKPLDSFYRDKEKPDGRRAMCAVCHKAIAAQRYAANPEAQIARSRKRHHDKRDQILVQQREYNQRPEVQDRKRERLVAHADAINAQRRKRYAANPGPARQRAVQYQALHGDRVRSVRRAYNQRNSQSHIARVRAWINDNRARANAHRAAWKRRNPAKVLAHTHKRRARLSDASGSYTEMEWQAMRAWFGNVCLCCKTTDNITIDHVIPVSKGGSNNISNLQPLCGRCNSRKHNRTVDYRDPVMLAAFLYALKEEQHEVA